jgi:hypothetical protein
MAAVWRLESRPAAAQSPQLPKAAVATHSTPSLQPASVTSPKPLAADPRPLIAAPGTELYTARRGEAIPTIARHYLGKTSYLTSSQLAEAIRSVNHKSDSSNILRANETIVIPGILPAPITEKSVQVPKDFEVRAVYLTGMMAASDKGLRIIHQWRAVGGNAVVFDIKDSDGSVAIPFDHPLLGEHKVYMHDVPKFVHFLHSQNMHAIARIAIFRDERLVVAHPELAVQSRKNQTAWQENGKLVWTDPSNPKVQEYDIALAKHVAQLGVDEVQFDYVRFPAEGDQKDAAFVFQKDQPDPSTADDQQGSCAQTGRDHKTTGSSSDPKNDASRSTNTNEAKQTGNSGPHVPRARRTQHQAVCSSKPRGPQRSDVIAGFLKKAYSEIHPTGVLLSLDVFGVMAWQRPIDLSHTGQDIVQMARYCDVLSPMIYPSHFFGMDNIPHPGDEPAHFIGESMDRFMLITRGSGVVIRPWLQAFHWRTKTYSPEYIKIQVETARTKGGIGFLFWNAANDYSKPYIAMPEMKAANHKDRGTKDNPKYFRGDELPATTMQASLPKYPVTGSQAP